jgi:hypothetical protein
MAFLSPRQPSAVAMLAPKRSCVELTSRKDLRSVPVVDNAPQRLKSLAPQRRKSLRTGRPGRGTFHTDPRFAFEPRRSGAPTSKGQPMGGLIYLIGLIVVIMAVLSLLGLR